MTCQFGYNCKYYLPMWKKCRKLIDKYLLRKNLLEEKWLDIKQAIIYLNLFNEDQLNLIKGNKIKIKRQKEENLRIGILVPWQYDRCGLADSGGECMYFSPHNGKKISYMAELMNIKDKHPN